MGAILPAVAAPGQNVYVVLMDMSSGQFWNGAAMEAYNQAHWANYAQSMGNLAGSFLYTSTLSGSLPAGNYWALPFLQAGGSPAVGSDTPLDVLRISYDGANVIELQSGLNVGKINGSSTAAIDLAAASATGVIGAATAGTLSTTQMTTNLGGTVANMYAGRVLYFTSGLNAGIAVLVTAYAVTGAKLTFVAYNNQPLPAAPSVADTFVMI